MAYKNIDLTQAAMSNVSEETAKEYIDSRVLQRRPLTQRAFDRAMMAAARCEDLGISADYAIEITIDKGWQGVVYEYIKNELARRGEAGGKNSGINGLSKSERSDEAFLKEIGLRH